jgi:hypothetical protein
MDACAAVGHLPLGHTVGSPLATSPSFTLHAPTLPPLHESLRHCTAALYLAWRRMKFDISQLRAKIRTVNIEQTHYDHK